MVRLLFNFLVGFRLGWPAGWQRSPTRKWQGGRCPLAQGNILCFPRDAKYHAGLAHHRTLDLSRRHQKDRLRRRELVRLRGIVGQRKVRWRGQNAFSLY